jgi:Tol biopolymer transport system component
VLGADTSRFRRPALSPDGTRVVYEDWTAGRSDVWLADVP